MHLTEKSRMRSLASEPFDSFYHRHTPRWQYRSALLFAFGGALICGGTIFCLAFSLIA